MSDKLVLVLGVLLLISVASEYDLPMLSQELFYVFVVHCAQR